MMIIVVCQSNDDMIGTQMKVTIFSIRSDVVQSSQHDAKSANLQMITTTTTTISLFCTLASSWKPCRKMRGQIRTGGRDDSDGDVAPADFEPK